MAEHVKYYDYEPGRAVTCPSCRWTGSADDHQEVHDDLFDVSCGGCGQLLLIVLFPTLTEVREAAASGNPRAIEDLPAIEEQAASRERRRGLLLRDARQLPELAGVSLTIEWAFVVASDGEHWQVLRHEGQEIWREPAFYESVGRFEQVFEILRARYGPRFAELRPTEESQTWLYGDALSSPSIVTKLNASLRSAR